MPGLVILGVFCIRHPRIGQGLNVHKFNFVVVYGCQNLLFTLRERTECEGRQGQGDKLDGWA